MNLSLNSFNTKVPLVLLIIVVPIVFLGTLKVIDWATAEKPVAVEYQPCSDNMKQYRMKKYAYTNPLLLADVEESQSFRPIRTLINDYLAQKKEEKVLTNCSVYLRKMDGGVWFAIDPEMKYSIEVVRPMIVLTSYLSLEAQTPGFLERKVSVNSASLNGIFSYRELLEKMIRDSNSDAENYLKSNLSAADYENYFKVLDFKSSEIGAVDMTKTFRIIFNGTYLRNNELSEYALKLLSTNTSMSGIKKSLPAGQKVAYLSSSTIKDELGELAIVYFNDSPYLLSVFAKGSDKAKMMEVVSEISAICWREYGKLYQ